MKFLKDDIEIIEIIENFMLQNDIEEFKLINDNLEICIRLNDKDFSYNIKRVNKKSVLISQFQIKAPMSGVLTFYKDIEKGDYLERGTSIFEVEALKFSHEVKLDKRGKVIRIDKKGGDVVREGEIIIILEGEEE